MTGLASTDPAEVCAAIAAVRDGARALRFKHLDGGVGMDAADHDAAAAGHTLCASSRAGLVALVGSADRELRLLALRALAEQTFPGEPTFPPPADGLLEAAAPLLASADVRELVAALQALLYLARPVLPRVIELLGHDDYHVVSMAAVVLHRHPVESARPALEAALPRSPALVTMAMRALDPGWPLPAAALRAGCALVIPDYAALHNAEQLDDSGAYALDVFLDYHGRLAAYGSALALVFWKEAAEGDCAAVLDAFADCPDDRGAPAMQLFARFRYAPARALAHAALGDEAGRHAAVDLLARIADPSSIEPLLDAFGRCSNPWQKVNMAEILADLGARAVAAPLLALLPALDPLLRKDALTALGKLEGPELAGERRRVFAELAGATPTRDRLDTLCALGGPQLYPTLLGWYRAIPDGPLLRDIPYAVARRQDPASIPTLIEMFELDKPSPSPFDLVLALGDAGAIDYLEKLLRDPRHAQRFAYNLVTALGKIGGPRALAHLERLRNHAEKTERRRIENEIRNLRSRGTPPR